MLERERKYLVAELPDLTNLTPVRIRQGYFTENEGETADPLRIRAAADQYELTKKLQVTPGAYGLAHELTIPLSAHEFAVLWPQARYTLEKDRYRLPLTDGLTAELDVFAGLLAGFTQVEVEFPDESSEQAFAPPAWFGRHITDQPWAWNFYYATVDWPTLRVRIKGMAKSSFQ